MGCGQNKEIEDAKILCFYETDDTIQKDYIEDILNSLNYKNVTKEIKTVPQVPFSIKLRIGGIMNIIQDEKKFDEETKEETIKLIQNKLKGYK